MTRSVPQNQTLPQRSSAAPGREVDPRSIALVAVFAALIVVAAVLPGIPIGSLGVPITLQTLAVMLAGLCLGPVRGALAVLLYLVLGLVGLPVFSGGRSGLQVLTTPSAGYLIGFVLAAFVVGLVARYVLRTQPPARWIPLFWLGAMLTSIVFVHTLGIIGIAINADVSLAAAFASDLVFYPGDIVKNLVAAVAAVAVHRAFPDILVRRVRRVR